MRLLISLFLSLLLLSSCGATIQGISITPTISEKREIPSSQGILVARLANASPNSYPLNYLTVAPKDFNQGKEVKMQRLTALGLNDHKMSSLGSFELGNLPGTDWESYDYSKFRDVFKTTVFSANLPAGDYTVAQLGTLIGHGSHHFPYNFDHYVNIQIGTFSIKPGKITDLGTIIFYPKHDSNKYINTVSRSPYPTNTVKQLSHILENKIDMLNIDNTLSWHEDELDSEREAKYISILNNPVTYNRRYLSKDGTMYFIGKLGSIVIRSRDGQWSSDSLDTDLDLLMMSKSPAGDLAIVAERGNLFYRKKGQQWRKFEIRNDDTVRDIYLHDNGIIDALILDKNVKIFRADFSKTADNSKSLKWGKIAWHSPLSGWDNIKGKKNKVRKLVNNSNKIHRTNLLQISGEDYIAIDNLLFKYVPNDWQIESAIRSPNAKRLINAGTEILSLNRAQPISRSNTYRRQNEDNKKWSKLNNKVNQCITATGEKCSQANNQLIHNSEIRLFVAPSFQKNGAAYSLAYNKDNPTYQVFLARSINKGQTWAIIEDPLPKKYCHDLILEIQERLMLSCKGRTLDFFESSDSGKSWKHVREHEIF